MVQNSREGSNIATKTFSGKKEGERGYYYASPQTPWACPDGWRMPIYTEVDILMNDVNSQLSTVNGIAQWWAGPNASLESFSGGIYFPSGGAPKYDGWDTLVKLKK